MSMEVAVIVSKESACGDEIIAEIGTLAPVIMRVGRAFIMVFVRRSLSVA